MTVTAAEPSGVVIGVTGAWASETKLLVTAGVRIAAVAAGLRFGTGPVEAVGAVLVGGVPASGWAAAIDDTPSEPTTGAVLGCPESPLAGGIAMSIPARDNAGAAPFAFDRASGDCGTTRAEAGTTVADRPPSDEVTWMAAA